MRVAYLDAASGISGDMTLGALVDAGVPLTQIQTGIDSLGLPDCKLVAEEVKRCGFRATKIHVQHPPEHAHRHLHHITDMIDGSRLTPPQQQLATQIFTRLGEAEARVHGTTLEKVHFHEVGAVDSIADIVGAAIAWDLLGVDRIECSPLPTGQGYIQIAHGRCSLPAPATAELLKGVPLAACNQDAELTTPTGAAIAVSLCQQFGPLPPMTVSTIGYGAGDRDFKQQPNILRLLVGEADESLADETVTVLEANLDDASGEVIGHATHRLLDAGALDTFTTAIGMKKSRPGVKITVLCRPEDTQSMEAILLQETSTLGLRRSQCQRRTLERAQTTVPQLLGVRSPAKVGPARRRSHHVRTRV